MPQESELSVLLIEDDPDAARLIQHVLTKGTPTPVAVESAGDLRSGLERLAARNFQAVLLDLNLPDSSGFDTFACIRQKAPDQAVIVLTGQEDEALALQAVRAGADEYLIKSEIRERFLLQRIRHAVERNRLKLQDSGKSVKNGRIFSFIGAKGGVGTTTLVVNLAAALAHADKTSLAIELVGEYGSFTAVLNRSSTNRRSEERRVGSGSHHGGLHDRRLTLGIGGIGRGSDATLDLYGTGCGTQPYWSSCRTGEDDGSPVHDVPPGRGGCGGGQQDTLHRVPLAIGIRQAAGLRRARRGSTGSRYVRRGRIRAIAHPEPSGDPVFSFHPGVGAAAERGTRTAHDSLTPTAEVPA